MAGVDVFLGAQVGLVGEVHEQKNFGCSSTMSSVVLT